MLYPHPEGNDFSRPFERVTPYVFLSKTIGFSSKMWGSFSTELQSWLADSASLAAVSQIARLVKTGELSYLMNNSRHE